MCRRGSVSREARTAAWGREYSVGNELLIVMSNITQYNEFVERSAASVPCPSGPPLGQLAQHQPEPAAHGHARRLEGQAMTPQGSRRPARVILQALRVHAMFVA